MVYVHLAEGFEEMEALSAVDILRRAGIDVETVSVTGRLSVTGAHGVPVVADILFADAVYDMCEMIVLPGGLPGATNLAAHEGLCEKLFAFANQGKWIAAICAAPNVLGGLGILDGRMATCYPGCEAGMGGATVVQDAAVPVVVDCPGDDAGAPAAKLITSRGPATAVPFALTLVDVLRGAAAGTQVAAGLLWGQGG